jgi:hypothetical protein
MLKREADCARPTAVSSVSSGSQPGSRRTRAGPTKAGISLHEAGLTCRSAHRSFSKRTDTKQLASSHRDDSYNHTARRATPQTPTRDHHSHVGADSGIAVSRIHPSQQDQKASTKHCKDDGQILRSALSPFPHTNTDPSPWSRHHLLHDMHIQPHLPNTPAVS